MRVLVSLAILAPLAFCQLPTLPPGLPTLPTLPSIPTIPDPLPTLPPPGFPPADPPHIPVPEDPERDVYVTLPVYGELVGRTVTLTDPWYDGIKTNNFLGIPFGADTGGENRFKWPEKAEPWTPATHDARIPGPACIQNFGIGMIWVTHPFWWRYSEDCLNLNVHAPSDMNGGPYPVMFWMHGGAYTSGINLQYPGHFLAANDVVVVVVNYRVHTMGFLSVEDPADDDKFYDRAPGNAGMMDQVLALEWVQENIEHFGGNKSQVTIFGQSAGAGSASLLMMSPKSQHLFHRVIAQSGAESAFWAVNWPSQQPNLYSRQVAEGLGCDTNDVTAMTDCLKAADFRDIVANANISCYPGHFCQGFAPIIDGEGGFLPDYPENIRARDEAWKGDLITGLTREDGSLYTLFFIPEAGEKNGGKGLTHDEFHHFLGTSFMAFWEESFAKEIWDKAFNAFDWFYSNWPHIEDLEANRQAFNKMSTDAAFGMPADRQARENSHGPGSTYWYVMGMRPKNTDDVFPEWMGVPHMGELPFMWGYPLLRYNRAVRNNSRIMVDIIEFTCEEDAYWSIFIQKMWTNFAKTGNPTSEAVLMPKTVKPETYVEWPQFEDTTEERDKLNYLYFENSEIYHADAYRQREYEFFRTYLFEVLEQKFRLKRDVDEESDKEPKKGMRSDLFQVGMEKLLQTAWEKRLGGEKRFAELLKQAESIKTSADYDDFLRPLYGIGTDCPPYDP